MLYEICHETRVLFMNLAQCVVKFMARILSHAVLCNWKLPEKVGEP